MTRIFLIRHAEAEGNIFRRAHGHYDGQIIGRGYAQIERLKERLKHEKIDAVYSSDLSRTRVTATAVYEPRNLQLHTTERLREVKMGAWEDMPWGDIEHNYPEMSRYFNIDPAKWIVADAEEFHNVQKRMMECISEIIERHEGETVAVFSHGFAIRAFICKVLGIQPNEIKKIPYYDNTAVTLLRCENGEITFEYQGDNSHLSTENSTFANQTWWRSKKERVFENVRIMLPDEKRDRLLLESISREVGKENNDNNANKEFVALLNEVPVGAVSVNSEQLTVNSENLIVGWIRYIFVRPDLRYKNFGVQLLGQAVSVFRDLGLERLRVCIPKNSPTRGFFEKFEFKKISEKNDQCVLEKNIDNDQ